MHMHSLESAVRVRMMDIVPDVQTVRRTPFLKAESSIALVPSTFERYISSGSRTQMR